MKKRIVAKFILSFMIASIIMPFFQEIKGISKEEKTERIEITTNKKEEEITTEEVTTLSVKEIAEKEIVEKLSERLEIISKTEDEQNLKLMQWFIEYKKLRVTYNDYIPYKTLYIEVPDDEIYIIQRCVETETRGQAFIPRCNVVSVILNRAASSNTTAYEIITAPNQFAYGRKEITEETKLAVEYVYEFGDTTDGCTSFRSDKHPEIWRDKKLMFIDSAGHGFYKTIKEEKTDE